MIDKEFARYVENLHDKGLLLEYPIIVAQAITYGWIQASVDEEWDMTYEITVAGDIAFMLTKEKTIADDKKHIDPFKPVRDAMASFGNVAKFTLAKEGAKVRIKGVVTEINIVNFYHPHKEEMASIMLDNGIKIVLFPRTWLMYNTSLNVRDSISVEGIVIYDGKDSLVNVNSITWLHD